nr:hypothetical protein [Tanacetum cinerariifolium]
DATICAFLANQPNGSQLVHEDLEQIYEDDLEEMDLKWQLTLLSIRAKRFFQKTGKKITINGSDIAGYDKSKVECLNVEGTSSKEMVAIDGAGFDLSYMADDEALTNMAYGSFRLREQNDGEAMINSIKNGDQPLPRVTQVSIAGTSSTEQPPLKDKSMWSDQEKRIQKIDRLARSLLIQELPNDIYSLIDSNKTAKDLWDALARHMLGSEYGEQDRKAAVLYEYETFKATEGELLLDTYIRYLQVINDLKRCGYSKDNCVKISHVSKMPFRKKPRDSMN